MDIPPVKTGQQIYINNLLQSPYIGASEHVGGAGRDPRGAAVPCTLRPGGRRRYLSHARSGTSALTLAAREKWEVWGEVRRLDLMLIINF